MLASLVVTALIGVIVVLFQLDEFGLRALATGIATTAASGLMVRLSVIHNKSKTKPAGIVGMAVVVLTFILVIPLIWWQPEGGMAREIHDNLWMMAAWIFLAGLGATCCLLIRQFHELRMASLFGLAISLVAFIQLALGTWLPDPDSPESSSLNGDERWFQAALATTFFGVVAAACVPRVQLRYWPSLGIFAAIVAWGFTTYAVFWQTSQNVGETVVAISTSIAVLAAYINLILFIPLSPESEWVRILALCTALLTLIGGDFLIVHGIWNFQEYPWHDWVGRITAATGIVLACDTVGLFVLGVINRYSDTKENLGDIEELTLTCPRCSIQQQIKVGTSHCSHCDLEFFIQIKDDSRKLRCS